MALSGPQYIAFAVDIKLVSSIQVGADESVQFKIVPNGGVFGFTGGNSLTFSSTDWNTNQKIWVESAVPGTYAIDYEISSGYNPNKVNGTFNVTVTKLDPDKLSGSKTSIWKLDTGVFVDSGSMAFYHMSIGLGDTQPFITCGAHGTFCKITDPDGIITYASNGSGGVVIPTATKVGRWLVKIAEVLDVRTWDVVGGTDPGTEPSSLYQLYANSSLGALLDQISVVGRPFVYNRMWVVIPGGTPGVMQCRDYNDVIDSNVGFTLNNARITGGFTAGANSASDPSIGCYFAEGYITCASDIFVEGLVVGIFPGAVVKHNVY